MPLEPLVIHGIYEAEGTTVRGYSRDRKGNPWVDIFRNGEPLHYGRVCESTQKTRQRRAMSNDIRRSLLLDPDSAGLITIRVISVRPDQDPEGPYSTIACLDIVAERAFEVLKATKVSYARHLFDSERGDPIVRLYEYSPKAESTPHFAFLVAIDPGKNHKETRRFYEERNITQNLTPRTEPGDYLIVRQVSIDRKSGSRFCVRLVNFLPQDNAKDPDGRLLLTKPTGYSAGDFIPDLPILSAEGEFGVGYVQRPGKGPYYVPVHVEGAVPDVGRYVNKAVIRKNLGDLIVAEKAA